MSPAPVLVALLLAGGAPLEDTLAWDGVSVRPVQDAASGVRFPVPLTGALLETRHFADAQAGVQARHLFRLSSREGEVLEVAAYENPKRLPLDVFVGQSLAFLRLGEHTELPWTVTAAKVSALLFEHPRSGQQYARRTAVFSTGGLVFVVTCLNLEDRFASGAFAAVLDGLEVRR